MVDAAPPTGPLADGATVTQKLSSEKSLVLTRRPTAEVQRLSQVVGVSCLLLPPGFEEDTRTTAGGVGGADVAGRIGEGGGTKGVGGGMGARGTGSGHAVTRRARTSLFPSLSLPRSLVPTPPGPMPPPIHISALLPLPLSHTRFGTVTLTLGTRSCPSSSSWVACVYKSPGWISRLNVPGGEPGGGVVRV